MVLERSRTGVSTDAPVQPKEAATAPVPAPETLADPAGSVSIALAQFYPRLGDVAANLAAHLAIIADAGAAGAGLVVFPELSLTGYFLKDQVPDVALTLESPEIHALRDASRAAAIDIVVGLILESDRHLFYNAALYISDGEVLDFSTSSGISPPAINSARSTHRSAAAPDIAGAPAFSFARTSGTRLQRRCSRARAPI
jgi:hypothetical protein